MPSAPVRKLAHVHSSRKAVGTSAIGYSGNADPRWLLSPIIATWMPKIRFSQSSTKTRFSRLSGSGSPSSPPR